MGAAFIPSLALACGVSSGSRRLFEIVCVLLWYLGSVERIPALDLMGIVAPAVGNYVPLAYLAASALLLVIAAIGRRRQLKL